jgi:charged multivesicular body protein 1
MASVVRSMDSAMQTMNLEKISSIMDKFETQFENLDVQAQYMETGMGNTTTVSAPADQVQSLMQQVADAHGLELNMQMRDTATTVPAEVKEQDDLSERLAKLRNQ